MKFLNDQRRMYLLSACLLALTIVLCCTWSLWGDREPVSDSPAGAEGGAEGGASIEPSVTPQIRETVSPEPSPEATKSAQTVNAVVYSQDNNGYLVPVMREIPLQDGIARATLGMMVSSPHNDMEAARLGLRTVMPEGTDIDLDISGGAARVNLTGPISKLPDAAAESNMVSAIVQTLTEFDTVETVRFLINGREVETLAHGTPVSGPFKRGALNLESVSSTFPVDDAQTVTLYFAGETGSLIVPVTRMVYGEADLNTAVLELLKGPGASSPLESALPAGCGLIDVTRDKDGKVTINLTSEFSELINSTDGGRQALRSLALTCAQFPGVSGVEVLVNGQPFDEGASTMSVPSFVNDAETVADQFLQTQSRLLFGPDDE